MKIKKEHADKHGQSGEQKTEKIVAQDHDQENKDLEKKLEEKLENCEARLKLINGET